MTDNNSVILTIGIPTYNNPEGLESQLKNFTEQIIEDKLIHKVEIIVSDNSDNDDTKVILENFLNNDIKLSYIKNLFNIGYDRNVDQVLSKSIGYFCWTISDNDHVTQDSVKKIISILEKNIDVGHVIIETNKDYLNSKKYPNYEALVIDNNNTLTGGVISQNIFNTSLLPKDRSKYYDNLWLHFSILLEIGAEKTILHIPSIFTYNNDKECRWAVGGATFIAYTNLLTIFIKLQELNYTTEFVEKHRNTLKKDFFRQIITGKIHGLKVNKKNLKLLYNHTKDNFFYLTLYLLIMVTPKEIFKILKTLKNI